ncbi:MAG: hypothetical protein CMJ75_02560 [Planctomycetaceae bacterium]|nr:hypothetical protein [Planctomycetaceae bacterium]
MPLGESGGRIQLQEFPASRLGGLTPLPLPVRCGLPPGIRSCLIERFANGGGRDRDFVKAFYFKKGGGPQVAITSAGGSIKDHG